MDAFLCLAWMHAVALDGGLRWVWLVAGGGVQGGLTYGSTDDFGMHAIENRVHVHDLHATVLHLMGIDHKRLTFRHGGRDYRLTDVHGHVVERILA